MSKRNKISVCVVAYRQERYIEECLTSILNQKCNFDFEIIVGVDYSEDRTEDIVRKLESQNKDVIKGIYFEKNVGSDVNFRKVHSEAKGDLIASMDGDDFWYPDKLQYQAQIFEKDPEVVQSWHFATKVDHKSREIGKFPSKLGRLLNPIDITPYHIASCYGLVGQRSTQMFRSSALTIQDVPVGSLDYYVAFLISTKGKTVYSKKVFGGYRVVPNNSMTTNVTSNKKITVDFLSRDIYTLTHCFPDFSEYFKANLTARYYMSKMKGHDLKIISANLSKLDGEKSNIKLLFKSCYYWFIQKVLN